MITGTLVHDVLEKLMALPPQERTPDTAWELLRTLGAKTVDDLPKYGLAPAQAKEDRKSTRLNSSHIQKSRMPSSA